MTALGHQPLVPRPEIGPQVSTDRIVRRATRGRQTPDQIRAELMSKSSREQEWEAVQRAASRMIEDARPKPRPSLT